MMGGHGFASAARSLIGHPPTRPDLPARSDLPV